MLLPSSTTQFVHQAAGRNQGPPFSFLVFTWRVCFTQENVPEIIIEWRWNHEWRTYLPHPPQKKRVKTKCILMQKGKQQKDWNRTITWSLAPAREARLLVIISWIVFRHVDALAKYYTSKYYREGTIRTNAPAEAITNRIYQYDVVIWKM